MASEAICAFIAYEAMNGTKVSTITRQIAAIRYAHALRGIDPLPTNFEAVRATMKGIRRSKGAAPIRKAPAADGIATGCGLIAHPSLLENVRRAGQGRRSLDHLGGGMATRSKLIASLIAEEQDQLRDQWVAALIADGSLSGGRLTQDELRAQCSRFLHELSQAMKVGADVRDLSVAEWSGVRRFLDEFSTARALQGFRPSETAIFLFALKEPVFARLTARIGTDTKNLANEIWNASMLLDRLALYTTEVYQKSRDEVIARQQTELLELSTPVVELSPKILALPLIGTLDSERTQVVMENLLQAIVEKRAEIAIIDISGVPTVDTLVAQHLIKTVAAARLMGAECMISGIKPQIAQTIVHLGLELDVISKAKLADAFALALKRIGQGITTR